MSKATHEERLQYVRENLAEIFESAEQPLSGSRSWMHKDDPWQYLAACIEFTNVRSGILFRFFSHVSCAHYFRHLQLEVFSCQANQSVGIKRG